VATGHHVTLKTSTVPREVARLRRLIRRALAQAGVPLTGSASPPHVTLNYRWDGPTFEDEIEPIVWRVREILLIESLTGQAKHDPHGRFPLIPRQGFLFPWLAEHKGAGVAAFR
jgi:2'-5' RNA ligase